MTRRRQPVPAIEKPISRRVACGHREHQQSSWNDSRAAHRDIEVPATRSNREADDESNDKSHVLTSYIHNGFAQHHTLRSGGSRYYHVLLLRRLRKAVKT